MRGAGFCNLRVKQLRKPACGPPHERSVPSDGYSPHAVGTRALAGHTYLALEDAAAGYASPCVLDAKIGLRTWYPWAPPALINKYRWGGGEVGGVPGLGAIKRLRTAARPGMLPQLFQ